MVIYIDLLFCCNLLVHFCLLSSTAALCMVKCRRYRLLLGSLLGSVYSFAIFLRLTPAEFMLFKAVMAISLILTTFGFHGIAVFLKRLLLFLAVNLVYAGAMLLVSCTIAPAGMVYRSGVAYFGGDTVSYVLGLLAGYALLRGFVWYLSRRRGVSRHRVRVRCGAKTAEFLAVYDSGNRLADVYSGRPVLLVSPRLAQSLLPEDAAAEFAAGEFGASLIQFGHQARLLPLHTAGGAGMTVCLTPEEILVEGCRYDWCIAAAKENLQLCDGADALLPGSFD